MLRGVSGNAPKEFTMVRKIHRENDRKSEDPSLSGNEAQNNVGYINHQSINQSVDQSIIHLRFPDTYNITQPLFSVPCLGYVSFLIVSL